MAEEKRKAWSAKTSQSNHSHLFRESGEEISSSEEVQDQVQLPLSLESCKRTTTA